MNHGFQVLTGDKCKISHRWRSQACTVLHVFLYKILKGGLDPQDKTWKIVEGLTINDFSRSKLDATAAELMEERDTAVSFLGVWLDPPLQHTDGLKTPEARLWWSAPSSSFIPACRQSVFMSVKMDLHLCIKLASALSPDLFCHLGKQTKTSLL